MIKDFFHKILSFLRVRSAVAGLEVSDEVLRLVYEKAGVWQMYAIRLAPEVVTGGIIKNRPAFVAAATELKLASGIVGHNPKRKVNVVVCLSSATPYSKVFRLPQIDGENLEKAIALNLQMASPSDSSETYSSWQTVGHDAASGQVEVLSAFMERPPVDSVIDALFSCGFVAMAVESKALALARLFRIKGSGIDIGKPYILVSIDSTGMDFLVIRNGALYFEYAHRWKDLENQKGEVPFSVFEDELKMSLRQVINFYAKEWTDPIAAVVIAAVAFHAEIEKTVAESIALPAVRLTLVMGQPISSEWLTALGCSLRERGTRRAAKEVSFLGENLEDRFQAEEVLSFLDFWRVIIPFSMALLVGVFAVANGFLARAENDIQHAPDYSLTSSETSEVTALSASSTAFNNEAESIASIESAIVPQSSIIGTIESLAASQSITISAMSMSLPENIVTFSGTAPSENDIVAFKDALSANSHMTSVSLPLTAVQAGVGNFSFSMTFTYK